MYGSIVNEVWSGVEVIYCSDFMDRFEFEQLRDLPDKEILKDVNFVSKKSARPVYVLEPLPVGNSLGLDLLLGGTYNPVIARISFNFIIRGVGPICRFCINGRLHPGAGRTHKHDLTQESDPRHNLPTSVVERPDLAGISLQDAWRRICAQAKIRHAGKLSGPTGLL